MKPQRKVLYNNAYYRKNQIKFQNCVSKLYKQYKKRESHFKLNNNNFDYFLTEKIDPEINYVFKDVIDQRKMKEYWEILNDYWNVQKKNEEIEKEIINNVVNLRKLAPNAIIAAVDAKHPPIPIQEMAEKLDKSIKSLNLYNQKIEAIMFSKQITTDKWLKSTSFWIPRRIREAVIGDIMEDCHELRALGKKEYRVRLNILWHLILFAMSLLPATILKAFTGKTISE